MLDSFQLYLAGILSLITEVYGYIFPEYPEAGLAIAGITATLFLIYLVKGHLRHALKISLSVGVVLTFLLFCLHYLGKLFVA